MARAFAGSSPHTRGAPPVGVNPNGDVGIIPAYAGSTALGRAGRARFGDHPRIRGEHVFNAFVDYLDAGSSPHTRGALLYNAKGEKLRGIIPAYAGSTLGRE